MDSVLTLLAPQAAEELQRFAVELNPNIPVSKVVALDGLVGGSLSDFRSTAWLFLCFAAVALALAAIGIYGLVSYSVTQHAYEIALRMAIGATGGSILRMILARSLRVGLVGMSAGIAGVAPTNPLVYAMAAAFLLAVITLASLIPAWHASRIDPVRVLRAE